MIDNLLLKAFIDKLKQSQIFSQFEDVNAFLMIDRGFCVMIPIMFIYKNDF